MQKTHKRKQVHLENSGSKDPETKQDPYPTHPRPTPEDCLAIRDDLLALHGFPLEFVKYRNQRLSSVKTIRGEPAANDRAKSEPSDDDEEKGEEEEAESVLDGLVKTVLSQNTTEVNSLKAFASLKSAFPTWEEVISFSFFIFIFPQLCFLIFIIMLLTCAFPH